MKRSEMLKEVFQVLESAYSHPEGNAKLAEDILTAIEKAGMLPPKTKNPALPKDMSMYGLASERKKYEIYDYSGPYWGMEYEVNEWEEEDEEEN